MNTIKNIGKQFLQSKILTRIKRIFQGIFVVRIKPWSKWLSELILGLEEGD
jgi:hypothetical protein